MIPTPNNASFAELVQIVERDGVRAGVVYLNSLTGHRFTALYRFDQETLRNLYFYDRENPAVESSDAIPIISSYCVFVRDTGKPFKTDDAPNDAGVGAHPKRLSIQSYCGVPLVDRYGKMFGTVCHFDIKPIETDLAQIALLEKVADVLQRQIPLGSD